MESRRSKRFIKLHLVCFIGVILIPCAAIGAKINVPSKEYPTIQDGIDAASEGDTVLVADGLYTGKGNKMLEFNGKAITVRSANGPENCIIDCEGFGSGFYFWDGEDENSVVSGFTIIRGNGAGIFCSSASPTISNCIIRDTISEYGGGIKCEESSPKITNCIITGGERSGIYCKSSSSPTISDCVITGNKGSGIECLSSSSPTIANCVIKNNTAMYGGGISCSEGSPTISNSVISENTATVSGGGVRFFYCTSPIIIGCTISSNTGGGAGGIDSYHSSPIIRDCVINDNKVSGGAGGVGFHMSSATVTNCVISSNEAQDCAGLIAVGSATNIVNCTIRNNRASARGGGICANGSVTATNSILWGNTPDEILTGLGGSMNATYCDIESGFTGEGNIDANPLFFTLSDHHLSSVSPCLDAGISEGAPDRDIDGDPRPQGSGYDIGADEYTYGCVLPVPDIRGTYSGSYTIEVSNCDDSSSDGMYTFSVIINITTQTECAFSGLAVGTIMFEGSPVSENIILNGIITKAGRISGNTSHTFLGTAGEGVFVGQLSGNGLTVSNIGQDTSGETCTYTRSIFAIREAKVTPKAMPWIPLLLDD